jgi:molybdopterin synthase sulfur carrier subunit
LRYAALAMQILVLYFAALREVTGRSEETLELPSEVRTVAEFVTHLELVRPELAGRLASTRIALDETFAEGSSSLENARVAALIPPVAGG